MSESGSQLIFRREYEPIPSVKLTDAVQFVGTGSLTTGSGDALHLDKTTKSWRRWVYFKCKKRVPDLCTNVYGNKLFIERIERACLSISEGHKHATEDWFRQAMDETVTQLSNPRSDSAAALDRLGDICLQAGESTKAITCFEYSLHMRRLLYGKEGIHADILKSLIYLGNAWAQHENNHRAIIVFEKALKIAEAISGESNLHEQHVQVAEIWHNLGTCWERLHEHHSAIACYERSQKIRQYVTTPEACIGSHIRSSSFRPIFKSIC